MNIDYQAVRSQIRIEQVLDLLKFKPVETKGPQQRGPCPIHGSHSATSRSFSVSLRGNIYRCFRCGSTGNQLDLWMAVTKRSIYPATIELCRRLGLSIPKRRQPSPAPVPPWHREEEPVHPKTHGVRS